MESLEDRLERFSPQKRRARPSIKRKQEVLFHTEPSNIYPPTKQIHQLTDDEIKMYQETFWRHDTDNSGTIDVKELGGMLKSMGREISPSDLFDLVANFDQDENGIIDFQEFLLLMSNLKLDKEDEEYLEAFNLMDVNNTGEIGAKELREFMSKLDCDMSDEDLRLMIAMADKTGRGKLTFQEFADVLKTL